MAQKGFPKTIRPVHERLAKMVASGISQKAAAKATGMNESYVSRLMKWPLLRNAISQTGVWTDEEKKPIPPDDASKAHLYRLKKYGVNKDRYDEQYARQRGVCAICGRPPARCLVVDHCHSSGRFRELLCGGCNIMLGMAKDRAEVLEEGGRYLRRHKEKHVAEYSLESEYLGC